MTPPMCYSSSSNFMCFVSCSLRQHLHVVHLLLLQSEARAIPMATTARGANRTNDGRANETDSSLPMFEGSVTFKMSPLSMRLQRDMGQVAQAQVPLLSFSLTDLAIQVWLLQPRQQERNRSVTQARHTAHNLAPCATLF